MNTLSSPRALGQGDRWRTRRTRVHAGLTVCLLVLAGGCQSYERQPLDISAHYAAFLARTPDGAQTRALAATLASRGRLDGDWSGESGGSVVAPGRADEQQAEDTPAGDSPAEAFNPADGVSCAEAEVIALVYNADLRLARLRAGVTQASAQHAGLWEDPTIGVDLTRIIQSTPEPWKVFTSVGLTIPLSGRLEIEKRRAGADHAAELARVVQREWLVRMGVRRAWSEWSALDAQTAAARAFLARVEQVLSVVDKMEQAGEMARTEARLFRIEKMAKSSDLAALESRAREVELQLRQLMGLSPDVALPLVPGHAVSSVPSSLEGVREDIDIEAIRHRSPAMLVAAAEYEAAERALELEVRQQYPDVHIGPGYGREDGQDQLLLGVSLPVPILNANRQRIAEATARREVARAAAEIALEQTVTGLCAAESRLSAATRKRRLLEAELVPLVDAQYADMRRIAELGELNTLVLLESLTRQQEAQARLVDARRDEALAAIDRDEWLGPSRRSDADCAVSSPAPAKAGQSHEPAAAAAD